MYMPIVGVAQFGYFFSQKQMLVFIAICGQCKVQVCTLIPEYYLPRV